MKKAKKTGRRPRQPGKRYNGVNRRGGKLPWVVYTAVDGKQIE